MATDPVLTHFRWISAQSCYRCDECDYRSDHRLYIRQHMVSHSNERPFKCHYEDCDKNYKRKPELTRHIQITHLELRPYACPHKDCDKAFTQLASLKHHIQSIHSSVRYRCPEDKCAKIFTCEKSMRCHQKRRHYKHLTDEQFRLSIKDNGNQHQSSVQSLPKKSIKKVRYSLSSPETSDDEDSDPNFNPIGPTKRTMRGRPANDRTKELNGRRNGPKNDSSFVYECNFENCPFKTVIFEEIGDHFAQHWQREWNIIRNS